MAKTRASFEIIAHDQNGERRPVGGDPFSVSVRGAAPVYAKVNDNGDGSYRVEYKPSTSGAYTIAITLHGVPMPGSPFALTVLVPVGLVWCACGRARGGGSGKKKKI